MGAMHFEGAVILDGVAYLSYACTWHSFSFLDDSSRSILGRCRGTFTSQL